MPKQQTLNIPYEPYPHQMKMHLGIRKARFSVVVTHRRAGKTVAAVNHLILAALESQRPNPRFAYIAPTIKMAKGIAWDYLKEYAGVIPKAKFNESELRVDLPNGARIRLFGVDAPDSLRGLYLDGVILDEFGMMMPKTFGEIIRPCLADRQGWCVFQGTPNGKNQFYDFYRRAQDDPDWYLAMYPWQDTGVLPESEVDEMRKDMTEDEFQQEMECSFSAAIRGAYYAHLMKQAEEEGRITNVYWEKSLPVHTAWDLGMSDSTVIWFYQVAGQEIRLIDYYENSGEGLSHYAEHVNRKPYAYGSHFAPHDIAVRELGSGKSRIEMANELGLYFTALKKTNLMDGINAVRTILHKCWFDEKKCRHGIECLTNYRKEYDERKGIFKSRPTHDAYSHGADAFRTLAWGMEEDFAGVTGKVRIPKIKVTRSLGSTSRWHHAM